MGVCLRLKAINWRTLGFWFNCKLEPTREEHSFFSGLHDVSADSPSPYSSVLGHMCSVTSVMSLCGPVDCSPPGSSVHGTLQVRILEWVAMPFFRESSQPRDWTLLHLLHCRQIFYPLSHLGSPLSVLTRDQILFPAHALHDDTPVC